MKPFIHSPHSQGGFTLIEVLSAIVILSIGLLGIAGLQAVAKKANADAIQRTTATMLANDIIERMRANKGQADLYLISNDAPFTSSASTTTSGDDVSGATQCFISGGNPVSCTPQQMALFDLRRWREAIIGATETLSGANTGGLVQPSACITPNSVTVGTETYTAYTVSIAWRGKSPLSNPAASTCGEGTGFYDKTAGDNVYRRLLTLNFYAE